MNFFDRQRAARGTTLRLVLLFTTAVLAIIVVVDAVVLLATRSQPASSVAGWLIFATAFTALIITGGTISKTIALRSGGSAVALAVGAVPVDATTTDPNLRRYVNIVEEMSLASGVPMPRLFVLEREPGINAFAAGYTPADAAITVTGGALQQLNRDELQGVIGHEFSHVLNGDMKLNIRLIGLLNGILLLGLVGLRILSFGGRGGDKKGGAAPILVIAIALTVLGFVGRFFASLIQAAVSRQREWLADASAVQFTRQTTGLEGALKKIAGLPTGSAMTDKRGAEEVRHMLFGEGGSSFSALFATHPPLLKRISALDPSFRADQIPQLQEQWSNDPPNGLAEDAVRGLADAAPRSPAVPVAAVATTPADVSGRVATMTRDDLAHGAGLSAAIAPALRTLASQPSTAVAFVLSMLLVEDPQIRAGQLSAVAARLGRGTADTTEVTARQVGHVADALRLPLASIAAPALVARPQAERDAVLALLDELARADGSISLFEYCLTRYLSAIVRDAGDPVRRSRTGRVDARQAQDAALTVLAALAAAGNADPVRAQRAFAASTQHLLPGVSVPYSPPPRLDALDAAWPVLDALDPKYKQSFVEAMVVTVLDDGRLAVPEAELLRTACGLLHCPLPALVA